MTKHALRTVYFHEGTNFHMQGKNFGHRVDISVGAKMFYIKEDKLIHVFYNGKATTFSETAARNWDYIETPKEILALFDVKAPDAPAPVKRGPGRPPLNDAALEYPVSEDTHRAEVRARSMNAFKAAPTTATIEDRLIQESRAAAMGVKLNKTAQVQNPQQVGEMAGITGKRKIMSHVELQAQVAKEAKE